MSKTMNSIKEIDRLFEKYKIIILKEIDMSVNPFNYYNFLYVVYICQAETQPKKPQNNIKHNTNSEINEYKRIFWNMPHDDLLVMKEALFVNPLKMIEQYVDFKMKQKNEFTFNYLKINVKRKNPVTLNIGKTECSLPYPSDLKRKSKLLRALCDPDLSPFDPTDIQSALFENKIKRQDIKEELFQLCKKIAYSKTTSISKISQGLQYSDFIDYD